MHSLEVAGESASIDVLMIDAIDVLEADPSKGHTFDGNQKTKGLMAIASQVRKFFPKTVMTVSTYARMAGIDGNGGSQINRGLAHQATSIYVIKKDQDREFYLTPIKNRMHLDRNQMDFLRLEGEGSDSFFQIEVKKYQIFDWEFEHSSKFYPRFENYNVEKSLYENFKDELTSKRIKKIYSLVERDKNLFVINTYLFLKEIYGEKFDINYFDQFLNKYENNCRGLYTSILEHRDRIAKLISCKKMVDWLIKDFENTMMLMVEIDRAEEALPRGYSFKEVFNGSFSNLENSLNTMKKGYSSISLIKQEESLKDFFSNQKSLKSSKNIFVPKKIKDLVDVGNTFDNCIKTSFFIGRLDGDSHLITYDNKYCIHFTNSGELIEAKTKHNGYLSEKENEKVEAIIHEVLN